MQERGNLALLLEPETIEKNRQERYQKNIEQKRIDKGLLTVMESTNETDSNSQLKNHRKTENSLNNLHSRLLKTNTSATNHPTSGQPQTNEITSGLGGSDRLDSGGKVKLPTHHLSEPPKDHTKLSSILPVVKEDDKSVEDSGRRTEKILVPSLLDNLSDQPNTPGLNKNTSS